jgi:glycine/sarcosine/betaine reductase complex component A
MTKEARRGHDDGGGEWMELRGKKVIALGERDSVPGEAIAEVMRSAGAEVIEVRTECFV